MELKQIIDRDMDKIVATLQQIVRIRSVEGEPQENMPFGEGVDQALEFALKTGADMGFFTKNIDHYAGHIEFGEGEKTLGILIHLDVVPEGDGWTYPPFEAALHNGKIFGRGVVDNKCSFAACLYGMQAIKELGLPLKRKIRMILGTNEETRWEGIRYYLSKEKTPDLSIVPDGSFPVIQGEKGILNLDLKYNISLDQLQDSLILSVEGGIALNSVPDQCQILRQKDPTLNVGIKPSPHPIRKPLTI